MTTLAHILLWFGVPEQAQPEVPSYGAQLVQTLIALVVVCILAYVILRWGLARFMGPSAKQGPMEILARLPLDGRQGLMVVRVADRVFLLGTGSTSPRLLAELNPDAWAEEMAHWADRKGPSLFERVLHGAGVQAAPQGRNEGHSDFTEDDERRDAGRDEGRNEGRNEGRDEGRNDRAADNPED